MPHFLFDQSKIAYSDEGEGPVVLLIPGLGGQLSFWSGVSWGLRPDFRVLSLDHPGSGGSESLTGALSLDRLAELACALLDHLQIERCHVIGQSMGGAIAQLMALSQPARIDRLVLSSTWAGSDACLRRGFELRLRILRDLGLEAYAKAQVLATMDAARIASHPDEADLWEQKTIANSDPAALDARIRAILAFDNRQSVSEIRHPTLVFGAEDDQVVPVHMVRDLATLLPSANCVIASHGGHFMPLTAPDLYLDRILPFLHKE